MTTLYLNNCGADAEAMRRAACNINRVIEVYNKDFLPLYEQLCTRLQSLFNTEESWEKEQAVCELCSFLDISRDRTAVTLLRRETEQLQAEVKNDQASLVHIKGTIAALVQPVYNTEFSMVEDYIRSSMHNMHVCGPTTNNRFVGSDKSLPHVEVYKERLFRDLANRTMPSPPHRGLRRLAPPPFGFSNLTYRKASITLTGAAAFIHGCTNIDTTDCTIDVLIRNSNIRNTCQAVLLTPLARQMPKFTRCIDANAYTIRRYQVDESVCVQLPTAFNARKVQGGWCLELPARDSTGSYRVGDHVAYNLGEAVRFVLENPDSSYTPKQSLHLTISGFIAGQCKCNYMDENLRQLQSWWARAVYSLSSLHPKVSTDKLARHVEVMGEPLRSYCAQLLFLANIQAPDLPKYYHVPTRKLSAVQEHHLLRCYLCRLCGAHQNNAAIMNEFLHVYAFQLGLSVGSTRRMCQNKNDHGVKPAKRLKCEFTRTNAVTGVNILDPCAIGACAYLRRGNKKSRPTPECIDVFGILEQRHADERSQNEQVDQSLESSEEYVQQDEFNHVPSYPIMDSSDDSDVEYFSDCDIEWE